MSKVLVFFLNGLGDAFMFYPALKAIESAFKGRVSLLTSDSFSNDYLSVFKVFVPEIPVININAWRTDEGIDVDFEAFREICSEFDYFINANEWELPKKYHLNDYGSHFDLYAGFQSDASHRVCIDTQIHMINNYFQLAQLFLPDCAIEDFLIPPKLDKKVEFIAERTWQKFSSGGKRLVIHTDSQPEKMWKNENYSELINSINKQYELNVITVGMIQPEFMEHVYSENVLSLHKTHLKLGWGVLTSADYFVGIDSVFLHIADLYNIPAIGLFGPTASHRWGLTRGTNIQSETKSMEDITVTNVLCELLKFLDES